MDTWKFIGNDGDFSLDNPEMSNYLYFPLMNNAGIMSAITPTLRGDCKTAQDNFLLSPASVENLHNDKSSRNFWVGMAHGDAWSVTGASGSQSAEIFSDDKDKTTLECGFLWHKLTRSSKTLCAEVTSFAPIGKRCELTRIVLTNIGEDAVTLTPTSAFPIYGRGADHIRDHRHVTSLLNRIMVTQSGVLVTPTFCFDERGHRENHLTYAVLGATGEGVSPIGAFPIADDFIGEGGSYEAPRAVIENLPPTATNGDSAAGYEAVGALRFADVTLNKGQSASFIIALAISDNENGGDLGGVLALLSDKVFLEELDICKTYWAEKLSLRIATANTHYDSWFRWVTVQPILRRVFGCSFLPHHDYGRGGRGWRDLWQDCLSLLLVDTGEVGRLLFQNFGGVRFDGTNATILGANPGEFIADRNNITRVWMDHGAWPLLTTLEYLNRSGDMAFLFKKQSYFKDSQTARGREKDALWSDEQGKRLLTDDGDVYEGTILEHILIEQLTACLDIGEHGNCLLRGADWNDAMDMADSRGESVAFTAFYAGNLLRLAELLLHVGKKLNIDSVLLSESIALLLRTSKTKKGRQDALATFCESCSHTVSPFCSKYDIEVLANDLKSKGDALAANIREQEWLTNAEGYSHFNSYYDNNGRQLEGNHPSGARVMLTGQVFAIMAGVSTKEQTAEIVKTADHYLYDGAAGGYRLNTDFGEIKLDMGRMFGFSYGTKENGAVFSHMATMYANALYSQGFAREGYKALKALYDGAANFESSRIYPGIPEYFDQRGRGAYHYLTGAASWYVLTVLTEVFGIKGSYGDLYFEPKLLPEQFKDGKATIAASFAGRKLDVTYINAHGKDYGHYKILSACLDEKPTVLTSGNILSRGEILTFNCNKTIKMEITLG